MDHTVKQQIKENLKNSIRNFFKNKEVKNYQVLDDIFPNERRIRSLIGGLETSLGTSSPLDISKDIWVEDEFWNFCSGEESTFEQLKSLFFELGQENFAAEFHDIFYQN